MFLAVSVVAFLTTAAVLARLNPEIFEARRRIQPGTKKWDRLLLAVLLPSICAILPVAALDDGRFHWSAPPILDALASAMPSIFSALPLHLCPSRQ